MSGAVEVYWVAGSGTNVGKTTIAAALIRSLERSGVATVGFKPYAAGMLSDLIDTLVARPADVACRLFGADAARLTAASPLTAPDWVDVVSPVQFLCYPSWPRTLMVRTGSQRLGNVEFFKSRGSAGIDARPDIRDFAAAADLPLGAAQRVDRLGFFDPPSLTPEKPQQAFAQLVGLGARAAVCEGAGKFLPHWLGGPVADHLFLLGSGMVHFHPDIRLDVGFDPLAPRRTLADLGESLVGTRRFSLPLPVAASARRETVADAVVSKLLAMAASAAARPAAPRVVTPSRDA